MPALFLCRKDPLRASDVRLSTLKQDIVMSCARASSTEFNRNRVSELLHFVDDFGANRRRYDKLRTRLHHLLYFIVRIICRSFGVDHRS